MFNSVEDRGMKTSRESDDVRRSCGMRSDPKDFKVTANTVFVFDIDGTLAPITCSPDGRKIDERAYNSIKRFHDAHSDQVIIATARDSKQIKTCFDIDLSVFPNILSNGSELRLPNGDCHLYPFNKHEIAFVEVMKRGMEEFRKKHPVLLTEIKDNEIGYHTMPARNCDVEALAKENLNISIIEARKLFIDLCDEARRHGVPYRLFKSHEKTHRALAHAGINKADSFGWFKSFLPRFPQGDDWSNVIFCGDGFLSNDREMAAKVRKHGGRAVMVTNGNNKGIPSENDVAEPDFALETPAELGCFLEWHVNKHLGTAVAPAAPKRPARASMPPRVLFPECRLSA